MFKPFLLADDGRKYKSIEKLKLKIMFVETILTAWRLSLMVLLMFFKKVELALYKMTGCLFCTTCYSI